MAIFQTFIKSYTIPQQVIAIRRSVTVSGRFLLVLQSCAVFIYNNGNWWVMHLQCQYFTIKMPFFESILKKDMFSGYVTDIIWLFTSSRIYWHVEDSWRMFIFRLNILKSDAILVQSIFQKDIFSGSVTDIIWMFTFSRMHWQVENSWAAMHTSH